MVAREPAAVMEVPQAASLRRMVAMEVPVEPEPVVTQTAAKMAPMAPALSMEMLPAAMRRV